MLSIIVPVYNVAPYLQSCLVSIVKAGQIWGGDLEILAVDDGSTDSSGVILDDFSKKALPLNVALKVYHQTNKGVSVARNVGLDYASGDWIGFVDGDDEICKDWFKTVMTRAADVRKPDVVRVRDLVSIWSDEQMSVASAAKLGKPCRMCFYSGGAAVKWAIKRYSREGWPVLNFFRREVIASTRFRPGIKIKEDIVFDLEIHRRIRCAVEFVYSGYFYRRRNGSALRSFRRVEDSVRFLTAVTALTAENPSCFFLINISRAVGYDLLQWMEERDTQVEYDPANCALRKCWIEGLRENKITLRGIWPWWRPGIKRWVKTGDFGLLKITMKIRKRIGGWIGR